MNHKSLETVENKALLLYSQLYIHFLGFFYSCLNSIVIITIFWSIWANSRKGFAPIVIYGEFIYMCLMWVVAHLLHRTMHKEMILLAKHQNNAFTVIQNNTWHLANRKNLFMIDIIEYVSMEIDLTYGITAPVEKLSLKLTQLMKKLILFSIHIHSSDVRIELTLLLCQLFMWVNVCALLTFYTIDLWFFLLFNHNNRVVYLNICFKIVFKLFFDNK